MALLLLMRLKELWGLILFPPPGSQTVVWWLGVVFYVTFYSRSQESLCCQALCPWGFVMVGVSLRKGPDVK